LGTPGLSGFSCIFFSVVGLNVVWKQYSNSIVINKLLGENKQIMFYSYW
jgi:hypothetical protein